MSGYEAEITDSEKVNIASEFILNAPPGEFNEVFNDVRMLLNNDQLLKDGASASFSKYNRDQFVQVELPNGTKTLITAHGELDNMTYLDPRSGQCFTFDHLRKSASDMRAATIDNGAERDRKQVESAVDTHISEFFPNGASAVYGSSTGSGTTIIVCIEGHKFNPTNFWNGRWRCEYSWNVGTGRIAGKLNLQVHYYEDGNVQLQANKDVSGNANSAQELVSFIKKSETDYQNGINENYTTMSETTFKALRRALPITKSKLDWAKITHHRVGKELDGK